jgi:hypothetical protein
MDSLSYERLHVPSDARSDGRELEVSPYTGTSGKFHTAGSHGLRGRGQWRPVSLEILDSFLGFSGLHSFNS